MLHLFSNVVRLYIQIEDEIISKKILDVNIQNYIIAIFKKKLKIYYILNIQFNNNLITCNLTNLQFKLHNIKFSQLLKW